MYNQQRSSLDKFKEVNEGMRVAGFKAQFVSSLISPLSSLITYLTIGVVALYGCFLVLSSTISLGQLQAFIRYIWQINDPISQVSQLSAQVQSSFSAMSRLFSFLNIESLKDVETKRPIKEVENN